MSGLDRPAVDRRARLGPVKDQGQRGTCVAFAATAGHELLRGDGEDLSEEFLHWAAKRRDGLPQQAEGTTLAAAARALAEAGQPPEAAWPYDERRDQWAASYCPPPGAEAAARTRRLAGGTALEPTAAAVRAALVAGQAVLLGVRLFATWHRPGPGGRIERPAPDAPALGGHAVLVVGYQAGADGERFVVRNSWGADWGDGGYGYLSYDYIDRYGLQALVLDPRARRSKRGGKGAR